MPERDDIVDVAIVGLGPTGAVLANLLGAAGRSVLVRNMIHASKQAKPISPTCCKRETVDRDRPSADGRRNNTLNHTKPASQVATTLTTTGIT